MLYISMIWFTLFTSTGSFMILLCGLNLLHTPERRLNCGAVTTALLVAPSNYWPSTKMAANASYAAWICCTFLSWIERRSSLPHSLDGRSYPLAHLSRLLQMTHLFCLKPPHIPELTLIYRTVTTSVWIAPSNQWSVGQDCSKCMVCGLNLPHIPELTFRSRTVTTILLVAPSNHRSVCLNLLHIPELILNCRAVTTGLHRPKQQLTHQPGLQQMRCAPGNYWSVGQDCCKGVVCGLNMLHIPGLRLNGRAVTTSVWILPQVIMQWSVGQDCSKCTVCGLNLLYIPELTFHSRTVTTMGLDRPR